MSDELNVLTSDLRDMSTTHDAAATGFSAAGDTTSFVEWKVLATHGPICWSSQQALCEANEARKSASEAMMNASNDLSQKLTTAASQYDQTDAQESGTLGRTMQC
ncbi:ESX-1 secretion-associated protein [Mycobacterium sp. DL440]|uniref:ESX-1 secretion-associated protein n=1 Tax=Mycobacterium sp. DL440 TaxID=2675523 RepID=UPI00141ED9E1|nr:ESX-1 secretion-associated protein [Mycobacterium sp. DL440]